MNRRDFVRSAWIAPFSSWACSQAEVESAGVELNDVHSALNPTMVERVVTANTADAVREAVATATEEGKSVSIAGGRHAMGGQQFGTGTIHLDTRGLNRPGDLDSKRGIIEVEAGIEWPALIEHLLAIQQEGSRQWGIAQKQTGADRLTLGGALAANAHGRGLRMRPFSSDVESFRLINAEGEEVSCSRSENPDLFGLVAGGYGLFGVVTSLRLRLAPRQKLERVVELGSTDDLIENFKQRVAEGYLYGDFQFSTDETSDGFLRRGVFSCYRPVDPETPIPQDQRSLAAEDWRKLIALGHKDKGEVFKRYSQFYLASSGQIYWSDTHQLSVYLDDYHGALDETLGSEHRASEVITEIYVPRDRLHDFLAEAAEDFRKHAVNVIYGTIRLIERDEDAFLAWAREPWACTIFNLHTVHTPAGIRHSADAFRRLIDMAVARGGSYFLTYHKYARKDQVEACYPQMPEFLELKRRHDPREVFQSEWYRHYRTMFG